jgi:hypothetical protein
MYTTLTTPIVSFDFLASLIALPLNVDFQPQFATYRFVLPKFRGRILLHACNREFAIGSLQTMQIGKSGVKSQGGFDHWLDQDV